MTDRALQLETVPEAQKPPPGPGRGHKSDESKTTYRDDKEFSGPTAARLRAITRAPGFRSNIDLVMLRENCDKVEAAKKICSWFGIDVPEPRSRSNGHIRNGGAANGNTEPPPPDDYEHDDADAPDAELSSNDSSQDKSPESQPSAPRPKPSGCPQACLTTARRRSRPETRLAATRLVTPRRSRRRGLRGEHGAR